MFIVSVIMYIYFLASSSSSSSSLRSILFRDKTGGSLNPRPCSPRASKTVGESQKFRYMNDALWLVDWSWIECVVQLMQCYRCVGSKARALGCSLVCFFLNVWSNEVVNLLAYNKHLKCTFGLGGEDCYTEFA